VPFFNALVWDPGSYNLLVEVDPGKTVTETDEGNNIYGTDNVAP
jgi:subtilase family serine protease